MKALLPARKCGVVGCLAYCVQLDDEVNTLQLLYTILARLTKHDAQILIC
jgi:hypothetical protein